MSEKYLRFLEPQSGRIYYGLLDNDRVTPLQDPPWQSVKKENKTFNLNDVILKAPVEPGKIICIGLNYHAHVQASQSADKAPDYPLIFLKPPSSVIGPQENIVHPSQSERVDYEAELGVVIGRTAHKVTPADAESCIFGYTCVNDVTARDLQKKDGQWSRAKGFDTFCPVGPWIVTRLNYQDVLVEGILNGKVKQSGRTSLMIFDIPYLISYISAIMTLYPGDLISTGTPAGIAPMKPGDVIEVKVEGIGSLINRMI
ncbi:MAG: fumarylacetoacetate hydrolase family protein [candidate division Zixibacteria bacterium]|nr:fumarylacetoacetate hydrolase family protein [candidate division Zixibacteria bacterium]MDD5427022.1 fumarylacetoacetate hydrolase family protein [candidate division Zixibacteria bacterium]